MYQLTFSNQSITELNKLSPKEQMELIEMLSSCCVKSKTCGTHTISHFNRDGNVFYRLRPNNLRVYFQILDDSTLHTQYILHQHSLTDFLFRSKLPLSEDQLIEQNQSFWKYLETLNK